jgi:hypothetical protein
LSLAEEFAKPIGLADSSPFQVSLPVLIAPVNGAFAVIDFSASLRSLLYTTAVLAQCPYQEAHCLELFGSAGKPACAAWSALRHGDLTFI